MACAAHGCAEPTDDARTATIIGALVDKDPSLARSRPDLVAGKHAQMARNLFDFYRGSLALYATDWQNGDLPVLASRFAVTGALPLSLGDAHPENFGLLQGEGDVLTFEPNDFDAADRFPYLWDVHRLLAGLVLAARHSNDGDDAARLIAVDAEGMVAHAAAEAYAAGLVEFADGAPRAAMDAAAAPPVLADLFKRGQRDLDAREELQNRTEMAEDGTRHLRRGVFEDEPENAYASLPDFAYRALPEALAAYRRSLTAPPPAEDLTVLDAVREFGSGIASWPRERIIILVRGPSDSPDDDVLLEMKELVDSVNWGLRPVGVYYDTLPERILETSRALWGGRDAEPLWGVTEWLGFPMQIRRESEAEKNIRVGRLDGDAGTPEALVALAAVLGRMLARMHTSPLADGTVPTQAVAARLRNNITPFADEQARFAVRYADQVERDWDLWKAAVKKRGPLLGFRLDSREGTSPDLSAVLGKPAPLGAIP